jgi:outer membrane protein assembly factor BamB
VPALLATPATARDNTDASWAQYQGGPSRTGLAPEGTPGPPYAVSWQAATGLGDPTQVLGVPTPILAGDVAIAVGRQTVDAIDLSTGSPAWSVPRALGPSSPAAVDGDTLVYVEGGGEAGASSTPTTAAASPTVTSSASASPSSTPDDSTLVGLSLTSQRRVWSVALSDVSHTGVVVVNHEAFVGADDGTITAVDLDGSQRWTQDIGDHVVAPMAASGDLLLAVVRPEAQGTAALVALHITDGSEAWRYEPSAPVQDLGAPSVGATPTGEPVAYLVGSDASVRAIDATDGAAMWAIALYSQTLGAPPAIAADGTLVVADDTGTVYALDPSTGAERWRFATNVPALGPPVLSAEAAIQPLTDGSLAAIALASGHQIWQTSISDGAVFGLAAEPGSLVASVTGTNPGLVGLVSDPNGVTEDVVSPTTTNAGALLIGWLGAAIPLTVILWLIGRLGFARLGAPEFDEAADEEPIDPWETDEDT